MRGSQSENQACGRGQEGGKARSHLQSVGWQGRLDSWAGWNAGEQGLSFFLRQVPGSPSLSSGFSMGSSQQVAALLMMQLKAPRSIKAKSVRVSEVSCHILLVKIVTGQCTDSRRGEINISWCGECQTTWSHLYSSTLNKICVSCQGLP